MKKFILSILCTGLSAGSMLAMEQDRTQKHLTEGDKLQLELFAAITRQQYKKALQLLGQGVDPNFRISTMSPLIYLAINTMDGNNDALTLAQKLIAKGGINNCGNALLCSYNTDINKLLIDAGIDIYYQASYNPSTALARSGCGADMITAELILNKAIELCPATKKSLKMWLLVNNRLKLVSKNAAGLVASSLIGSLAEDLRANVVRAGAHEAIAYAQSGMHDGLANYIRHHLDINILKNIVEAQLAEEIRNIPIISKDTK